MKFAHRFAYYLVGLVIGLFFVALVFTGKDTRCNYFPNARVLNDIRNKPFNYSEKASQVLAEPWIDTIDIKNTLQYGDVDFDKSNTEFRKAKVYVIEGKTMKNIPITLKISNGENKATLEEIIKN
ncbi:MULTISPECIES: DUF4258 domain-containing protein [unclassified Flavobacterium]|uniref:DUF4258 domain-containing protein n=1 Tax=unclassified Flavobacterium TaxID=196869 RepID=UPI001570416B|nr:MULTISPECIES: DUF4258 domain-containing protein [unclassified Flavobacterium]MBE0391723.1 hypothetical protein [Flavobacterium sp. PL002]NRT14789.1 hypothetical protein [Flavobacterium sp. 28A]